MITSTKNCTKNKKRKMDRQNARTNDKSKAIQTKSQTAAYTPTLTRSEKVERIIYLCSQSPLPQFWADSFCIQVFHRCGVLHVEYGDFIHYSCGRWERFPFGFFVRTALLLELYLLHPIHLGGRIFIVIFSQVVVIPSMFCAVNSWLCNSVFFSFPVFVLFSFFPFNSYLFS